MFDLLTGQTTDPVSAALRHARLPLINTLFGKVLALGYRLTGKARYDDFRMECLLGMRIVVMPSVLNPKVMRSGGFFASRLDAEQVHREAEVLDMGTGSGVCALAAARYARRVVAVDINAAAVRCARINALLNHLDHKIDARHGDLFEPVAAERFDLILFNPPFLRGQPGNDRDRAWRSTDVVERFAAGLGSHLKPGGSALVLLSTFGDSRSFLGEFRRQGFEISVCAECGFVNERLAIFKLSLQGAT
jgi:release factor glutamine methyltransferase